MLSLKLEKYVSGMLIFKTEGGGHEKLQFFYKYCF